MDSLKNFRAKLALLESMLSKVNQSHTRVVQLKRSVYVLRTLLKDHKNIKSPYGPNTPIVRFSLH